MKRLTMVLAGGALLLSLTIAGAGRAVFAQDSSATPATESAEEGQGSFLDALAASLGISREELDQAITDAKLTAFDDWAANARESLESGECAFPGFGSDGFSFGGDRPILSVIEGGWGNGGFFGRGEHSSLSPAGARDFLLGRADLSRLAEFLGMAEEDLTDAFSSGQTLVEIAEEQGISVDELRTYLIERATEAIDQQLSGEPETETTDTETGA